MVTYSSPCLTGPLFCFNYAHAHTRNRENELVSLGSGRVKKYVFLAFHCITTSSLTDTKHGCENEALNPLSHTHARLWACIVFSHGGLLSITQCLSL